MTDTIGRIIKRQIEGASGEEVVTEPRARKGNDDFTENGDTVKRWKGEQDDRK